MKRTIYKFSVPVLENFTIDMPKGAEIIRVDFVDGQFFFWAIVYPEFPLERRKFFAVKTGGDINDRHSPYIGCAAMHIQQELMPYFFEDISND